MRSGVLPMCKQLHSQMNGPGYGARIRVCCSSGNRYSISANPGKSSERRDSNPRLRASDARCLPLTYVLICKFSSYDSVLHLESALRFYHQTLVFAHDNCDITIEDLIFHHCLNFHQHDQDTMELDFPSIPSFYIVDICVRFLK